MSHKEIAVSFLQMAGSGQVREAYEKYVSSDFKHHNVWYPGDRESLLKGMEESHENLPHKVFEVQFAFEGDSKVAVYSKFKLNPEAPEMVVCHIVRFEGDLIAEMWDIGQEIPVDSPNKNGAF